MGRMTPRERVENMVRMDPGDMTVWSKSEADEVIQDWEADVEQRFAAKLKQEAGGCCSECDAVIELAGQLAKKSRKR